MSIGILEIVSLLTIILTGGFSIYGLVNDYKNKDGSLTKHGRIAIYGIIVSLTLSIIGFGFKLKSDSIIKAKKLKQIQKDIKHQNKTINKLDSVISYVERVSVPLTDLDVKITYSFTPNSKQIERFHKNEILPYIEQIKKSDSKYHRRLSAFWENEKEGLPDKISLYKVEGFDYFPELRIPISVFGICANDQSIDSVKFKGNVGINFTFTAPVYSKNNTNIRSQYLNFNLKENKYYYEIRFTPSPQFSDLQIISHLDLKNTIFAISSINDDQKGWITEEVEISNRFGFKSSYFDFIKTKEQYPEITNYSKKFKTNVNNVYK
jgi:hypothetical protein